MQGYGWNLQPTESADASILASIGGPISVLLIPLGFGTWQMASAAITGFIAKENVVGTIASVYAISNFIDTEELTMAAGAGADVASVLNLTPVAALACMMFNLFTPPCFAAIGAMNAELKDKKWLYSGIALQFGTGYSIAFLATFFGNLFTKASYSSMWMPVLGWILVLIFATILGYLIIKRQNELKLKK
jgi:ferrous iron transport protein B